MGGTRRGKGAVERTRVNGACEHGVATATGEVKGGGVWEPLARRMDEGSKDIVVAEGAIYCRSASDPARVAALVDADAAKVGEVVGGLPVRHIDELPQLVRDNDIAIGVVATPANVVQDVADLMVAAGIRSILNFAPAVLSVPAHVDLRKVDLAAELQILSFHEQRKRASLLARSVREG